MYEYANLRIAPETQPIRNIPKSSKPESPWTLAKQQRNFSQLQCHSSYHGFFFPCPLRYNAPTRFSNLFNTKDSASTYLLSIHFSLPQFPHCLTRDPMTNSQPILASPVTRIVN